jgi:pyruvate dehydrogenase E2 component (dihydrolipoamide acetyltransferase)
MAFEFKLPDIGEGVVEGEIVKWLVKEGDPVDVDQPMVEVMTDKATVVIPSPKRGVIQQTRGKEGDIIQVHSVLVVIDESGQPKAETKSEPKPEPKPEPKAAPKPEPKAEPKPEPKAEPKPQAHAKNGGAVHAAAGASAGGKVLAAPATRRLARELNVELASVQGSGPAGRVTSEDVRNSVIAPPPARTVPERPATATRPAQTREKKPIEMKPLHGTDERIPVRGLRKRIWENMVQSSFTAAHFTFVEECDATELVALRKRFNDKLKDGEPKFTYLPFIVKAVVAGLEQFPMLNGHVDDDAMEFIKRAEHHIGIAVASERGLIVPVVRHADRRSLVDLQREIVRLADAVRENKLTQDDLGGSTFTITSLGKDGGIFATPIINYPEVAIMGVHKMSRRPVVKDDDQIVIRDMMNLSLSFDHRLIDGHVGAAYTYAVIRLLENPDRLMMEMS